MVNTKNTTQSYEFMENLINTVREPLISLDQDLRVVTANRSFYEFFKVKPEETVGQLIYDLGDGQWDIPKLCELLETILPQKTIFNDYEVEHDFATIGRRIMLLNARQIEQRVGKERIILLAIEDITERKRLEDLLAESEERYRRLFETADDGILLLEKNELKIRQANPAITSMLDYSNAECSGNNLKDIGFPDSIGAFQEVMQTLERHGIIHYNDVPIKTKNGQLVDTDIYMVNRASLVQCNVRNITKRKLSEVALSESKEKFQSIVDNIGIGVALISPTMEILELNQQMREWFPEIDPRKRSICYCAFNNPPRDAICDYCPTCRTLQDGKVHEATVVTPTKDGPRNYRIVSSPIFDKNGKVTAAIEMVDDITERILLEKQLQQAQKMESVGQLAGGVAHDFNNMLSVILGYGNIILETMPPDDPLHECAQEIVNAGIRSASITRQLLAFARKQTIAPQVLDLNETIEEMLKMLRRLIGEDIDLNWHPSSVWPIYLDPSQLDQIMANLCVNARDAIDGVGKVTIETETTTFDETYCSQHQGFIPGEFSLLSISDNGIGMDSDIVSRIFEPFFTTKQMGKGTGLGLATVYGIVKQNNGFTNVYSEPGNGTTFRIYLPRYTEQITSLEKKNEDVILHGKGETILVVEDEASILKLTSRMLTRLGYTIIAANSPPEALNLAKEHGEAIDLLITDVIMPELSGRDLADRLISLHPNIKCLFMSGYTSTVIARHGVLKKGTHFIQKPFSARDLGAKVNEVLKSD